MPTTPVLKRSSGPASAATRTHIEPGVLVVACDGARAVLFQHELSQVLERLNIFFGFDAIARIRIVQKPVVQIAPRRRHGLPPIDAASARRIEEIVQGVDDEKLRKSLAELGPRRDRQGPPQLKS